MPRPRGRRAREARGDWSSSGGPRPRTHGVLPLDDRTIELFGARFRDGSPHRADRHYTYRPPMSPMPAQVGAQIGGRSWDLDAAHRPRRRRRTACSTRPAPRTPASASSSRTSAWCSTTTSSATHHVVESDRPGAGRRVDRRRAVPPHRHGEDGNATLVIDGEPCGAARRPVRHEHHLEHRAERRPRPRLAGERPLPGLVPVRGHAAPGRHPARSPSAQAEAAAAASDERAAMGRQ